MLPHLTYPVVYLAVYKGDTIGLQSASSTHPGPVPSL